MSVMFESAIMKLERVEHYVHELDKTFTDFMHKRPHHPIIKGEPVGTGQWTVGVQVAMTAPFPVEIPLILGDAIHNYRCVLDHLIWEMIAEDGGSQSRYAKFPFGKMQGDFENFVNQLPTPELATKSLILNLGAFEGGPGNILYGVHALDNRDKHQVITPVVQMSQVEGIVLINLNTGERTELDPFTCDFYDEPNWTVYTAPPGFGIDADYQFGTTRDIFFPTNLPFAGQPIIATLAHISMAVEAVMIRFQSLASSK